MAEPTLPPTARKLERARARGEAGQSALTTWVLVLVGVAASVALTRDAMVASWRELVIALWTPLADPEIAIAMAARTAAGALAWPLGVAVVLGALGSRLQVGTIFSAAPLAPDPSRLSPARIFSGEHLVGTLSTLVPALAVLIAAVLVIFDAMPGLLGRTELAPGRALDLGGTVIGAFVWRSVLVLAACAAIAALYARVRFLRAQRMTRAELRQEQRETEGEPHARRRRAQLHREAALAPPLERALEGALLVVSGSGRAVIVARADGEPASVVVAARGALAARACALARERGTPIAHDDLLARELERTLDGGALARASRTRLARHLTRAR
jgi:flagellar biosynthetic protein FlhB